jgi:hypothetical protein
MINGSKEIGSYAHTVLAMTRDQWTLYLVLHAKLWLLACIHRQGRIDMMAVDQVEAAARTAVATDAQGLHADMVHHATAVLSQYARLLWAHAEVGLHM